ncbi:hypothetical protein KUTeg_001306, partial [Tegillarca granosa]
MGSSIIYWACRMANRLLSRHLRLEHLGVHISWFGKRGMIWEDVLLTVSHKLTYLPPPKVLILHVGANNIPSTNTGILCNRIKQDIHQLAIWMPDCFVIWSDLICRLNWRREISIQTLERKRKRINRMGRGVSTNAGGSFIKHPDITFDCPGLFRPDQVHLSDIGNAIFLNDLQYCLESFFTSSVNYFVKALLRLDPRGRNLAMDVSWEVQGQNV